MRAESPSYDRPLAGAKVLDLSQGIAGPYCGMLLAQYGAEVIKVEPAEGDWGRTLGARFGDHTAIALSGNRGKRSIALDLKSAGGRGLLARLAARADVFIENFRPGVSERLGVGYGAVQAANPNVIYVSISAFGQNGPRRSQPGSDMVAQAFSGMMMVNRAPDGPPKPTGFYTADTVTALYAFQAVAMSLAARAFEGKGRHLDISLVHASAAFLTQKVIEGRLEGAAPKKINVPAGSYRTRDGWITVTLTKETHFAGLARTIGREDLLSDARFASFAARAEHAEALLPIVREAFADRASAEWLRALAEADVLCSPINSVNDWAADPHTRAVGTIAEEDLPELPPIPWVKIPGAVHPAPDDARTRWPDIGGDAQDILREALGLDDGAIDALVAQGVVILKSTTSA